MALRSLGFRIVLAAALSFAGAAVQADLIDDFDTTSPGVTSTQSGSAPGPVVTTGGPTGDFLRLINDATASQRNQYSYDRTDAGAFSTVTADFDFRGYSSNQPADGFAFALLRTSAYGTSGAGPNSAETPSYANTVGLGFGTYSGATNRARFYDHGTLVRSLDVPLGDVSFRNGVFHHAHMEIQQIGNGSNVLVQLTGDVNGANSPTVTVMNQHVSGLLPFESRAHFSGRTGGSDMDADFDNISVAYSSPYAAPPTISTKTLSQDFDSLGTTGFVTRQLNTSPGPLVQSGGTSGNFLRLINDGVNDQYNSMAFDRAYDGGVSNSLRLAFDFRANDANPADGFSMILLPTAIFGTSGAGVNPWPAEKPNVANTFGIGFDFYPYSGTNDVSVHIDGTQVANYTVAGLDMNNDQFHRAEIVARHVDQSGTQGSLVTINLTPDVHGTPGTPVTVCTDLFVPGLTPMDYRVQFAGRTGGSNMNVDLDNIVSGVAPAPETATTQQTFDGGGTQYKAFVHNVLAPAAVLSDAGSDGSFLRLMHNNVNDERNSLALDRARDGGVSNSLSAQFDFRCNGDSNPADGFSMLLVPTATYGETGDAISATQWVANKPNVASTFGLGFSFYQAAAGVNDVSVHWNGAQIANNRLNPAVLDLDQGVFHQANLTMQHVAGGSNLNLTITPDINGTPGAPVSVFSNLFISGMTPYDYRVEVAAPPGGANMDVDLDNVLTGVAPGAQPTGTVQNFDGGGSQYKAYSYRTGDPNAQIVDAGGNNVLRLLSSVNDQSNGVAFDRSNAGLYGRIEADWDFSMLAGADGGAFALINTGLNGTSGIGPYLGEEPNVSQTFAIGFDVYNNINDISLHWNGAQVAQVGTYDYRGAGLKHAHAIIDYVAGGANVTLDIDGNPIFTNQFIAGMAHYESRVGFGGRTGGVNTTFDLDNVNVQWSNPIAQPTDPFHWKGFTGNYPDNTKWTNDILPTGNDNAVIGIGLCNSSNLTVEGTGSLTIDGSGTLNNSGVLRSGYTSGMTGRIIQGGNGQVTTSSDLYIGDLAGSTGYYTIGGDAVLTVNGTHTVVGRSGVGHFTQNDNSTVNLKRLFLAEWNASAGSTYTMNGGTLNVNYTGGEPPYALEVGRGRAATFTLNDGTVNVLNGQRMVVGSSAAGVFNQGGGTVNASGRLHLGEAASGTGVYTLNNGAVNVGDHLVIGLFGTGTFNQNGGTVTQSGGGTYLGDQPNAQGTYNLSGGTLNANYIRVGQSGGSQGTFNQSGGTVNVTSRLHLGDAAGSSGTYNLSGGLVDVNEHLVIGVSGTGVFNQSGGVVTQTGGGVYVGDAGTSVGTYNLSGGTLNANYIRVAQWGGSQGTFNQTGGVVNDAGDLFLADGNGAVGAYNISGNAQLTVGGWHTVIGRYGVGHFTQSDNAVVNARRLFLAEFPGSDGTTYTMNGGTLNVAQGASEWMDVGRQYDATFTQNAGTVNDGGDLNIGLQNGAVGNYFIHDGSLTVGGAMYVGRGNSDVAGGAAEGHVVQTGGTVDVNGWILALADNAAATATYDISGGQLNVNGTYFLIGRTGQAHVTQSGDAVVNANRMFIAEFGTSAGTTYTMSGGTLDVSQDFRIAAGQPATYTVQGGAPMITVNVLIMGRGRSTLATEIGNDGIGTINVATTASVGGDLDVDIWGGVALTTGTAFDIMRTATAGNISGTVTHVDAEPIWTIIQDGTVIQAVLSGPDQGPIDAGYGPLTEVAVNGGAGANSGYLTINECINCEDTLLVALDVVDAGGDLDPAELEALADYMRTSGQTVFANGTDDHTVFDYLRYADYDLVVEFTPEADTSYFSWDFSDYDPDLLVRGLAVGLVPEPATVSLLGLGALALLRRRRRRQRP